MHYYDCSRCGAHVREDCCDKCPCGSDGQQHVDSEIEPAKDSYDNGTDVSAPARHTPSSLLLSLLPSLRRTSQVYPHPSTAAIPAFLLEVIARDPSSPEAARNRRMLGV